MQKEEKESENGKSERKTKKESIPSLFSSMSSGQMVYVGESDLILFLCSPHVTNLDDMAKHGLYLSDIPLHDATRDLLLLSEKYSQVGRYW